jgi:hypothetical protein
MRYKSLALSAFSLLLLFTTLHLCSSVTRAADNDDERANDDSYAETARVVRVSLIAGDVNLRRAGSDKWERATLNVPLVEGDRLATGANSRVEIQIDARNFLRVGEYATLDVVTLRDEGVALSLPAGTATLRLARFNHDHEYFEIDAPATTIAAEKEGLYRLDVDRDGKVRVAVRDGGRARLYSQSSGFTLRDGRVAEMVLADNSQEPDWQFSDLRPFDSWDSWVDERERDLIARLRYDGRDRYYDDQVFGAEELDSYGDWVSTHDYGYVWRPRTTVINNYYNWAPYRYGRWDWCEPYGWVWVGDEPWGWAPYHYGRWVYVDNYWCWAPRGYAGYGHRSWWRPALVSFVNVNLSFGGGDHICWYPLPYHHRDPQSNFWRRLRDRDRDRRDAVSRAELANLKHLPPGFERAVSGLPKGDFGKGNLRPQPTDAQTAKLALATDPVRGRLPVRPVEGNGLSAETRARLGENKRAALVSGGVGSASDPLRHILERPTGAASRKPGVALDDQLRRERILNNREPIPARVSADAKGGALKETNGGDPNRRITDGDLNRRMSGEDSNGRSTGAVARPARPVRLPDANGTNSATDSRGAKNGADDPKRTIRPVRPTPEMENERPRDAIVNDPSARKTKSDTRDELHTTTERERARGEYDRPAATREERREPPAERREPPPERRAEPAPRYERPEPRHEERPSPPPREERSSPPPPREERSAPHESRSSSESKSSSSSKSETHSESSHPSHSKPPE